MTEKPTILICDDDGERVQEWAHRVVAIDKVASQYQVANLTPTELAGAFMGLTRRKSEARSQPADMEPWSDEVLRKVDGARILVVDHDLTPTAYQSQPEAALEDLSGKSGNQFAKLARHYSRTGLIVLVNMDVQGSTFDLTMMRFAESFADLNITDQDIDRRTLWLGEIAAETSEFRPSHWPMLIHGPNHVERALKAFELDDGVLRCLGLDGDVVLSAFEGTQLDSLGDDPVGATFRDIARAPSLGLDIKDAQPNEGLLKRIAAYGVVRWLNTQVLPGQNVLVDLPHLLERLPKVMTSETFEQLRAQTLNFTTIDEAVAQVPRLEALSNAVPPVCSWLPRPVWLWPEVEQLETQDANESWSESTVFCEDDSQFHDLNEAREFEAGVPGPYSQRFVRVVSGDGLGDPVSYQPRNRLLR